MIYIVIQFIPYSPLNEKGNGNLPIEVSGFRCQVSGVRGSKVQDSEVQGFKGSGFNEKIHSDNPERGMVNL